MRGTTLALLALMTLACGTDDSGICEGTCDPARDGFCTSAVEGCLCDPDARQLGEFDCRVNPDTGAADQPQAVCCLQASGSEVAHTCHLGGRSNCQDQGGVVLGD